MFYQIKEYIGGILDKIKDKIESIDEKYYYLYIGALVLLIIFIVV